MTQGGTGNNHLDTPLIDETAFQALKELDDDGRFLKDLLDEFNKDMKNNLKNLHEAINTNNVSSIGDACHAIKNAAGSLAAGRLFEQAKIMMEAARNEQNAANLEQFQALSGLYVESRQALTARIYH